MQPKISQKSRIENAQKATMIENQLENTLSCILCYVGTNVQCNQVGQVGTIVHSSHGKWDVLFPA